MRGCPAHHGHNVLPDTRPSAGREFQAAYLNSRGINAHTTISLRNMHTHTSRAAGSCVATCGTHFGRPPNVCRFK